MDEPLHVVGPKDGVGLYSQSLEERQGVGAVGVQDGEQSVHRHRPNGQHPVFDKPLDCRPESLPAAAIGGEQ